MRIFVFVNDFVAQEFDIWANDGFEDIDQAVVAHGLAKQAAASCQPDVDAGFIHEFLLAALSFRLLPYLVQNILNFLFKDLYLRVTEQVGDDDKPIARKRLGDFSYGCVQ